MCPETEESMSETQGVKGLRLCSYSCHVLVMYVTLRAPDTKAADGILKYFFILFFFSEKMKLTRKFTRSVKP